MQLRLNEAEVAHAIKRYAQSKFPPGSQLEVTIFWRGKFVKVDVVNALPGMPVLTDAVSER